ncbi:MAG TPA: VIT domain-containing protein [Enhygromyxa sp.]|nr:VIT domain-containing protein [Enhygromyxa sp.]
MSLLACTPYGELEEEVESDVALDGKAPIRYSDVHVDDDDRAVPVAELAADPRCWTEAGKPSEAWEIDDPNADPVTGTLAVQHRGKLLALPLQHTRFDTVVVGTVAETEVTQIFSNPFDEPIEAVYMFPLHERAAVDDYWLKVGERAIRGQMQTREQARETYEQAKHSGRTAGLLEQQRPNLFTQHVANILPGERIEVSMHVVQPLEQEHGVFSLVLPTVVGPRYVPDTVRDAQKITAPSVPEGDVTCADLDISVAIESGLRPRALRSKFHAIDIQREQDVAFIELDRSAGPVVANRDFVLTWDLGRAQPQAAIVAQAKHDGGYFTLTVQPPELVPDEEAVPRELVFVVDNSGSMDGVPIDTAKALMRRALAGLRPDDAFTVLRFSDDASGLSSTLLPASEHNLASGLQFIDAMYGEGGTDMTRGIHAALDLPRDRDRLRIVLFLTDGYIGNESDVFELIERDLGDARLFALGVGVSPNRYLLDGMATVGRGAVSYAGEQMAIQDVVNRFYERIETPVLTDLEIDWQGLAVAEVLPGKLPDLFAGQPLTVFGRYQGTPSGTIVVRGHARGELVEIPVRFELAEADDLSGVSSIWARNKIDALLGYPNRASSETTQQVVTELALQHRIMTEFTSFVAVEERHVVNPDGTPTTIVEALPLPEGTNFESPKGEAFGVGGYGLIGRGGGGGTGSGYGRGSGGGFGGRGKRVPMIQQAQPTITGSLDRDIIRRIVRAHINEVRSCYNAALTQDPNLAGRVTIEFTIAASGKVVGAVVHGNDTGDAALGTCVAKAVKRWLFPKPKDSGEVVVRYPFVLSPG